MVAKCVFGAAWMYDVAPLDDCASSCENRHRCKQLTYRNGERAFERWIFVIAVFRINYFAAEQHDSYFHFHSTAAWRKQKLFMWVSFAKLLFANQLLQQSICWMKFPGNRVNYRVIDWHSVNAVSFEGFCLRFISLEGFSGSLRNLGTLVELRTELVLAKYSLI